MGADTEIAWADDTFNPWWGCVRVSPGCEHCYAETFAAKRFALPIWGAHAERKAMSPAHWKLPHRWNREAEAAGKRRRVFCASMADVFELGSDRNVTAARVLSEGRERLWEAIAATPNLDWMLLTKRPENVHLLSPWPCPKDDSAAAYAECALQWPKNVWVGTTVEDQKRAEERIPWLLEIPAAVRFVSAEPLLGPVDLTNVMPYYLRPELSGIASPTARFDAFRGHLKGPNDMLPGKVDWLIIGGESGPGARAFNPTWAKDLISQTRGTRCAVFMKQMGDNVLNLARVPLSRKGGNPAEWPEEFRVRQWPRGAS